MAATAKLLPADNHSAAIYARVAPTQGQKGLQNVAYEVFSLTIS